EDCAPGDDAGEGTHPGARGRADRRRAPRGAEGGRLVRRRGPRPPPHGRGEAREGAPEGREGAEGAPPTPRVLLPAPDGPRVRGREAEGAGARPPAGTGGHPSAGDSRRSACLEGGAPVSRGPPRRGALLALPLSPLPPRPLRRARLVPLPGAPRDAAP